MVYCITYYCSIQNIIKKIKKNEKVLTAVKLKFSTGFSSGHFPSWMTPADATARKANNRNDIVTLQKIKSSMPMRLHTAIVYDVLANIPAFAPFYIEEEAEVTDELCSIFV